MRIAILSDVHDHVWNLRAAMETTRTADALIFCGDLCSPFVVPMLAAAVDGPVYLVFGNNDGDQARIVENAARFDGRVHVAKEHLDVELGGKRFAVNHYPRIAESIAAAGQHNVVCHGHNHRYRVERRAEGRTLLVNPGTLMGWDAATGEDVAATFVVYDTVTGEVERVELPT